MSSLRPCLLPPPGSKRRARRRRHRGPAPARLPAPFLLRLAAAPGLTSGQLGAWSLLAAPVAAGTGAPRPRISRLGSRARSAAGPPFLLRLGPPPLLRLAAAPNSAASPCDRRRRRHRRPAPARLSAWFLRPAGCWPTVPAAARSAPTATARASAWLGRARLGLRSPALGPSKPLCASRRSGRGQHHCYFLDISIA